MEVLLIVAVILAAYVVYSIVGNSKTQNIPEEPVVSPQKPATRTTAKVAAKPAPKPADEPAASSSGSKDVRNPATGETAIVQSNYRFTKRWIKEALVEEGLLDKVYKNSELDDATSAKVKDALAKFREMEKYLA